VSGPLALHTKVYHEHITMLQSVGAAAPPLGMCTLCHSPALLGVSTRALTLDPCDACSNTCGVVFASYVCLQVVLRCSPLFQCSCMIV
jgi:hypothetical protein